MRSRIDVLGTDGEKLLDYTLAAPVSGKVGVWSKTDSIAEMAEFTVKPE